MPIRELADLLKRMDLILLNKKTQIFKNIKNLIFSFSCSIKLKALIKIDIDQQKKNKREMCIYILLNFV